MAPESIEANRAAVALLANVQRAATGSIRYAGRTFQLRNGQCLTIGPTSNDALAWEFFRENERVPVGALDAASAAVSHQAPATGRNEQSEQAFLGALFAQSDLDATNASSALRALYLERLVACLREASAMPGALLTPAVPAEPAPSSRPPFNMLVLLLDGLSRSLTDSDTAAIGRDLTVRLQWIPGSCQSEARQWANLGDHAAEVPLASIFAQRPASATAVAALVQLGLARLRAPYFSQSQNSKKGGTLPPPAPRLARLSDSSPPGPQRSLPPPPTRHSHRPRGLAPGEARVLAKPFVPVRPPVLGTLDPEFSDPLRALELEIDRLEAQGSPGHERAAHWIAIADIWEKFGCSGEATRALREACAAQPHSNELLQRTALACASTGEHDLAIEYASACLIWLQDQAPLNAGDIGAAELLTAQLHMRAGDIDQAIAHASLAAQNQPIRAEALELVATWRAVSGQPLAGVAGSYRAAAKALAGHATRASALWASAWALSPTNNEMAMGLSASLAASGYPAAASAILADRARQCEDKKTRINLWTIATRAGQVPERPQVAVYALLRSLELQPNSPTVRSMLVSHIDAGHVPAAEQAAILQELALTAETEDRPPLLRQTGLAHLKLPGEEQLGRWLLRQAAALGDREAQRYLASAEPGVDTNVDSPAPPTLPADIAKGLARRLAETESWQEQALLYRRIAGLQHAAGDNKATVSAALKCLALMPDDTITIARLLRASAKINNDTIHRDALAYAARIEPDDVRRAQHLLDIAALCLKCDEVDEAIDHVDAALLCDRQQPAAAIIALRAIHRVAPSRAHAIFARTAENFPDLPPLLEARATTATAVDAPGVVADMISRWIQCAPLDPRPRRLQLQRVLDGQDSTSLLTSATGLLQTASSPGDLNQLIVASDHAATRGELAGAAQLLHDSLRHFGDRRVLNAERALEYARLAANDRLVTTALEHLAQCQQGKPRLKTLKHLSEHHRRRDDRQAELRTRVRLLAESGYDLDSIERLSQLFAAAGDGRRLGAVLTLALQTVRTPTARQELWLRMATARYDFMADQDGALRHLSASLEEQPSSHQAARRTVGVALSLAPTLLDGLHQVFSIIPRLPSELAAYVALGLVRTAEETLCDRELALQLAAEAVSLLPQGGEILLVLEELAIAEDNLEPALHSYSLLIKRAAGRHGRRTLHYRAARLLEKVHRDHDALGHLLRALLMAPSMGTILSSIERVAERLADFKALQTAYSTVARHASDSRTQIRFAEQAYRIALEHAPDEAPSIAKEFSITRPTLEAELGTVLPPDNRTREPVEAPDATHLSEIQIDSCDPILYRAETLLGQAEGLAEANALLAHFVSEHPSNVRALRGLYQSARALNAHTMVQVSAQLLKLFDSNVPSLPAIRASEKLWNSREAKAILGLGLPPSTRRVLSVLWHASRTFPESRAGGASMGNTPIDAKALARQHIELRAFGASAARKFGTVPPELLVSASASTLSITLTRTPSVVVPETLIGGPHAFIAVAWGVAMAQQDRALLFADDPSATQQILSAARIAFSGHAPDNVASPYEKSLASMMWESIPIADQSLLRDALLADPQLLDFQALKTQATQGMVSTILLLTGAPDQLCRFLAANHPTEQDLSDADGFSRATDAVPELAQAIRTVLSDPYLALISRVASENQDQLALA